VSLAGYTSEGSKLNPMGMLKNVPYESPKDSPSWASLQKLQTLPQLCKASCIVCPAGAWGRLAKTFEAAATCPFPACSAGPNQYESYIIRHVTLQRGIQGIPKRRSRLAASVQSTRRRVRESSPLRYVFVSTDSQYVHVLLSDARLLAQRSLCNMSWLWRFLWPEW
jgi:hypothetical protein